MCTNFGFIKALLKEFISYENVKENTEKISDTFLETFTLDMTIYFHFSSDAIVENRGPLPVNGKSFDEKILRLDNLRRATLALDQNRIVAKRGSVTTRLDGWTILLRLPANNGSD